MDIGPVFSIDIALRETRRDGTSAAIPTTSQSKTTHRRRIVADRIYSRQVLGIKDWVAQSVIEGVALGLPASQSSTARPNYLREMRVHRVGWIIVFLFRHPANSPHRLSACPQHGRTQLTKHQRPVVHFAQQSCRFHQQLPDSARIHRALHGTTYIVRPKPWQILQHWHPMS